MLDMSHKDSTRIHRIFSGRDYYQSIECVRKYLESNFQVLKYRKYGTLYGIMGKLNSKNCPTWVTMGSKMHPIWAFGQLWFYKVPFWANFRFSGGLQDMSQWDWGPKIWDYSRPEKIRRVHVLPLSVNFDFFCQRTKNRELLPQGKRLLVERYVK
jgi:hypothetical protein